MDPQFVIEGNENDLAPFLDSLAIVQHPDFRFEGRFETGLNENMHGELVAILLSGLGSTILKLIVEYFSDKFRNEHEITIKRKQKDGTEVTLLLKGKSDKDILEWLKDTEHV